MGGTKGQDECKEGRLAPRMLRVRLSALFGTLARARLPPEDEQREGTMVRPTSPLFTLSALLALCLANVAAKTGGGGIRGVRALVRLRIFAFMKSRHNLCRVNRI